MSTLEIIANLLATLSILLAAKNSIYTWPTGIVACLLLAILFYQSQLYAETTLQCFFIISSALGWWQWYRPQGASRITFAPKLELIYMLVLGIIVALSYGYLLQQLTDAFAPFIDASVLMLSVIAQVLLMKRRLQTWLFWLLVNTISVPLFISRELYLTALLYGIYWYLAWFAGYHWYQEYQSTKIKQ